MCETYQVSRRTVLRFSVKWNTEELSRRAERLNNPLAETMKHHVPMVAIRANIIGNGFPKKCHSCVLRAHL